MRRFSLDFIVYLDVNYTIENKHYPFWLPTTIEVSNEAIEVIHKLAGHKKCIWWKLEWNVSFIELHVNEVELIFRWKICSNIWSLS